MGRKYLLVVYVTIHNADETIRGTGPRLLVFDQLLQWEDGGSHLHSYSREAGPSRDVWDMSGWRAISTRREHSPQVWVTQGSFLRHESSSQREREDGKDGKNTHRCVLKGRCHKASMLDSFILDPQFYGKYSCLRQRPDDSHGHSRLPREAL